MIATPEGERLLLWDTPGFGDSVRLAKRLRQSSQPIGWFLSQVWDRWRDRPFWASQQAMRNLRDEADVMLYLVNAAESPEAAGYVAPEMELLAWVGKPVIALLNQLGPPGAPALEAAELARWRSHLAAHPAVRAVLPLDAFARCWVQEATLLRTVEQALDGERRARMGRLRAAWQRRDLDVFDAAMHAIAEGLSRAAMAAVPLPDAGGLRARLRSAGAKLGRGSAEPTPVAQAQEALARQLDAEARADTQALIRLHGLEGSAEGTILARLASHYQVRLRMDEGQAALWGGVVSGALVGLKADLLSGGLTLGGGLHRRRPARRARLGRAGPLRQSRARHRVVVAVVERRGARRHRRGGAAALPRGGALRPRPRRLGRGRVAAALEGRGGGVARAAPRDAGAAVERSAAARRRCRRRRPARAAGWRCGRSSSPSSATRRARRCRASIPRPERRRSPGTPPSGTRPIAPAERATVASTPWPISAVRDRLLVRLLVAVLVHRLRVDRGARRPARPDRALEGDPARRDLPGRRAEEPGGTIRSSANTRCTTSSARRATPACPTALPDPFPIATQNAARVFWWLADQRPATAASWARHCLRAYFTRNVNLADASALKALAAEFGIDGDEAEGGVDLARKRRRGCARSATTRSRTASSARPSSSSTASRSGATTGAAQIERWLQGGSFQVTAHGDL